jgi:tetratricopeptide (TPR) repeat protein
MARRINTQFLTILALVVVGIGTALFIAQLTLIKDHPSTFIKRGDDAMRDQLWTEAYAAYSRAAQLDPRDPEIQVKLGRALHGRGQIDPQSFYAEQGAYQRALDIDPNYLSAINALIDWYRTFLPMQPNAPWYREAIGYARRAAKLNPNDIRAAALPDQLLIQQWAAGLQTDQMQVDNALTDLRTLIERDPSDADLPFSIARAKIEDARRTQEASPDNSQVPQATLLYNQSIQEFERPLGADGKGPQADNALMHGRFGELLEYLSGVDISIPENRKKYLDRAQSELDRGRALIKPKDPGYYWLNQYSASFAERRGNFETAVQIYKSLPDSQTNRRDLALVLSRDAKTRPDAERLMEQLLASLGDDPTHLDGARITLLSQLTDMHISDYINARSTTTALKASAQTRPSDSQAADAIAAQEAVSARLAALVQSELNKLNSAVGSRNPLELRRSEAHFQMACDQYDKVITKLTTLSDADPTCLKDEALQFMLASSYSQIRQTSKAVEVLQKLVDLYPRDVRARKEYVKVLLIENPDLARLQMTELERMDVGDPDLNFIRIEIGRITGKGLANIDDYKNLPESTDSEIRRKAYATIELKDWEEARRLFAKMVAKDPKDANSWVNLVKVLMTQGKKDEAMDNANKGLALNPDDGQLKVLIDGIKSNDPRVNVELAEASAKSLPDKMKGELAQASIASQSGDSKSQEAHLNAARALAPDSPEVLSALFDFYLGANRPDDAAPLLPKLSSGNYDGADGELYRLHLAMARGDSVTGMVIAKKLTQTKADFAFSYVALGDVLQQQKQYEQAIIQYGIAVQKQRSNISAYIGLAKCDYALNRPTDALRWINEGLGQQHDNAGLRQMLVLHKLNYGSPQEAIDGLKQEIRVSPNDPALISALGDCMVRLAKQQRDNGNPDEASKSIRQGMEYMNAALEKWPDDARLYMSLANSATNDNKVDLAEQILHTWALRDMWKNSPEPHIELCRFYEQNGKPMQAEAELQAAMVAAKNDVTLEVALADLFRSHKRYDEGVKMLRTVNSDNPTIRAKTVELLRDGGRYDEAEAMIKTELASHPASSATLLTIWSSLLLNRQKYDEAAKRADEALALLPNDPAALYCRGRAKLRSKPPDSKGALEDMKAVSVAMPNNPQVCLDLAAAYLQMEQPDDAAAELETALHIDPKNKPARMMLVQIYEGESIPKLVNALGALRDVENTPPYDTDPDIFQSEAVLLGQLNQSDLALEKSTRALRLSPKDPVIVRSNLDLLLSAGKYQDARKRIDTMPDSAKKEWWVLLDRGLVEKNMDDAQAALNDMVSALAAVRPLNDDRAFAKVIETISQVFGTDNAIAALKPYIADTLRARLTAATLYHLKGDDQNAVATIDPSIAALSKFTRDEQISILTTAAPLYQTTVPTPLVDKAHDAYEQWLALEPSSTTALNNFAWLLDEQYNPPRLKEALEYIQRAVEEMNKGGHQEPKLLDTQGWLLIQSGETARGVNTLEKVIELKPFPEAYLHLGEGLLRMNYAKDAKAQALMGLAMIDKMDAKEQDQNTRQKLQNLANRADELLKPKSQAGVQ